MPTAVVVVFKLPYGRLMLPVKKTSNFICIHCLLALAGITTYVFSLCCVSWLRNMLDNDPRLW
jgi:hypothetical protein